LLRGVSTVNLGMPDASNNSFVCIAAYNILHRSINGAIGFLNNEKAAGSAGGLGNK
jgi:hypothetical protein